MNIIHTMTELQLQERAQADVMAKLLILCFLKPMELVTSAPDWADCFHVAVGIVNKEWRPDAQTLEPMLHNLIGVMQHRGKVPVDVCVMRSLSQFAIFVKVE